MSFMACHLLAFLSFIEWDSWLGNLPDTLPVFSRNAMAWIALETPQSYFSRFIYFQLGHDYMSQGPLQILSTEIRSSAHEQWYTRCPATARFAW